MKLCSHKLIYKRFNYKNVSSFFVNNNKKEKIQSLSIMGYLAGVNLIVRNESKVLEAILRCPSGERTSAQIFTYSVFIWQ